MENLTKTYLMIDRTTNYIKIGKSKNIFYREKTLQAERPTIEGLFYVEDDIEKLLHSLFSKKRLRGEWFNLNQENIDFIDQIISQKGLIKKEFNLSNEIRIAKNNDKPQIIERHENKDIANTLITKSNNLVESRYKFDIWETRFFAKMLTLLKPHDTDFQLYHIHVGSLLKDFNLKDGGDNYSAVKQAAKKLLNKVIEIPKETPDGLIWDVVPLLSAKGFVEPRGDNFISVQFHQELKPYLLELKERYLQYDIRNLWGLSSVYSVRIYELLKQYEKVGKRFFDLEDLKTKLAIQPTEYEKYNHFKEKIILKAQGDLANCTDIAFSMEEHKQGRKVSSILFFIYPNSVFPPP